MLSLVDSTANGLSSCLQPLVMAPTITASPAALEQLPRMSSAVPSPGYKGHIGASTVEVRWAGQNIVQRLDEEFDGEGFSLPQFGPFGLAVHRLLPFTLLLLHTHHLA